MGTLIAIALSPRLTRTVAVVYPKQGFRSRLVNTFVKFGRQALESMRRRLHLSGTFIAFAVNRRGRLLAGVSEGPHLRSTIRSQAESQSAGRNLTL